MTGTLAKRLCGIGGAAMLLAGCAGGSGGSRPATPAPAAAAARPVQQPVPGDLVLGRTAPVLVSLFGQPALDVREGPGRKLQFSGPACVLDAYLYPPRSRAEAVATHVDARLPDGRDTDRNACAASLRRR